MKQIKDYLNNVLSPDGIWLLGEDMTKLLDFYKARMPKTKVSNEKTRYPTDRAEMRAFLDTFFAKHFFQMQNIMLDSVCTQTFIDMINCGKINIIDIGCGPGVASLAFIDLLNKLVQYLQTENLIKINKKIKLNITLNDSESICLGTAQKMIRSYKDFAKVSSLFDFNIIAVSAKYPKNTKQLTRISDNICKYDFMFFSYVINQILSEQGINRFIDGIESCKNLCNSNGKIFIAQDRFSSDELREISQRLNIEMCTGKITQKVYAENNSNDSYTYTYNFCEFTPSQIQPRYIGAA